jgi:hypothetical protein
MPSEMEIPHGEMSHSECPLEWNLRFGMTNIAKMTPSYLVKALAKRLLHPKSDK